jgi:uncharacterized membrane protein
MQEITLENWKPLDKRYEAIAWGVGFVWIGILGLIPGNQNGIGLLSIGLILLGLNLARFLRHIPLNGFTIVLGILLSTLGLVSLIRSMLNFPPLELDLFPIMLIVIGLYFLVPGQKRVENG